MYIVLYNFPDIHGFSSNIYQTEMVDHFSALSGKENRRDWFLGIFHFFPMTIHHEICVMNFINLKIMLWVGV